MLEVYLNIIETGDMIFGIGAASQIYFKKLPLKITRSQAALVAATIPNPKRFSARNPSGYIFRRQSWILGQMSSLGGSFSALQKGQSSAVLGLSGRGVFGLGAASA